MTTELFSVMRSNSKSKKQKRIKVGVSVHDEKEQTNMNTTKNPGVPRIEMEGLEEDEAPLSRQKCEIGKRCNLKHLFIVAVWFIFEGPNLQSVWTYSGLDIHTTIPTSAQRTIWGGGD